jgi:type IV pilus assembly protein PilX
MPTTARSRGATLIVALVMLVLMSLIGATVARIGVFDELGARGARDQKAAFEAADAAVRDAEGDLRRALPVPGAPLPILTPVQLQRAEYFDNAPFGFIAGCGTGSARGLCAPAAAGQRPVWQRALDDAAVAVPYGTFSGQQWPGGDTARVPAYVIEAMELPLPGYEASTGATKMMFRITAAGAAALGQHTAAVQSVVVR